jgi:hypothetical protein
MKDPTFDAISQHRYSSQERALAAAVVERAVEDLTCTYTPNGKSPAVIRAQARRFFTGGGEWARSRATWFAYLDLDEDAVFRALKDRLEGAALTPYTSGQTAEVIALPQSPRRHNSTLESHYGT